MTYFYTHMIWPHDMAPHDMASHYELLHKVFALLKKYKLYIKESKYHLFLTSVVFLGHIIDEEGVQIE